MSKESLRTDWTNSIERDNEPDSAALRSHLRAVHHQHAGFTESCAMRCRDQQGRTSYEWLADAVARDLDRVVLDLACGSGPLLNLCDEILPSTARLIGVDMSPDELALAGERLPAGRVQLVEAQAQQLGFLEDDSVDVALCHWALTLMDPVRPALDEIARVLAPGGRFAAIVDGPMEAASGYTEVHDLIYSYVQAELPNYGRMELGDPRVRSAETLVALLKDAFPGASVDVETRVVDMSGPPETLAEEAAGFFYAAFVLSSAARRQMLEALAALLSDLFPDRPPRFAMPINRIVVELPGTPR